MANVLVVEDNDTIREGVGTVVTKMGHQVFTASDGKGGLSLYKQKGIDFTISDLKMEGMDGLQLLQAILEHNEDAVVMLITAFGSVEYAVEAMKCGAFDFVTKPFTPEILRVKVDQGLAVAKMKKEQTRLKEENRLLRFDSREGMNFANMVGVSAAMKQVFETIKKVAHADSSVLIFGESGTGKELVAQAIHELGRRKDGPFIRVNCGALAETLLESEMFGHEKGAFTGALRKKLGRFELADNGSIFLDEIGEISPTLQLKLLRVLQEKEFERVGGEESVKVDVRVIAATNRDLQAAVASGQFREDLYYRLHIVPITIPPLRERPEDIEALTRHFIKKLADRTGKKTDDLSKMALEILTNYRWPGNVRELENVIEQAMVFSDGAVLQESDLPSNLCVVQETGVISKKHSHALEVDLNSSKLTEVLDQVEKTIILYAFERAKKVKTDTARRLGIKTSALYYKLQKYGIE